MNFALNSQKIIIDQWNIYPYQAQPEKGASTDLANLQMLSDCLLALGAENDTLLPVFISVLVMVGLYVYSIDVKE